MISEVVLVPGLWMPGTVMAVMAWRLRRAGFETRCFTYSGRDSLEANLERLARSIEGRAAHLVGHSLGGVLVYDLLRHRASIPCANVVLLGAPVRGCFAGRRFGTRALGRWMLGGCAPRWRERDATWRRREPLGVIAGTRVFGLARALGSLPGENDGVVRLEETTIEGMSERVLVREPHSMLPVSADVAHLVQQFLRRGTFA